MRTNPLDTLLEIIPWPVLIVDEDGLVIRASACWEAESGGADLAKLFSFYLGSLTGDRGWLQPQEVHVTRTSFEGRQIQEKLIVRRVEKGGCIIVVDETDSNAAQTQGAQTVRLAALGFMIAGVSHEISNPLASIHSIVQLMRSDPQDSELMSLGLGSIALNVERILQISRRLLTFSRMGDEPRERLSMDQVVAEVVRGIRETHPCDQITLNISRESQAIVLGNFGQLREVLLNLLLNAIQAMEGRGAVSIETQLLPGGKVRVTVMDEGPGVPDKLAGRIFEPFFTTKSSTVGTGLGLAVSKQIVEEHRGRLWLAEHSGPGATFHLELPTATHERVRHSD